jgi:Holliday junction resolvase
MAQEREGLIQKKIVAKLRDMNYIVRKLDAASQVGWPDLIAISPEGVVYFFEVKTTKGKLSKLQERTINQLKGNQANVHVVRSVEDALSFITQAASSG